MRFSPRFFLIVILFLMSCAESEKKEGQKINEKELRDRIEQVQKPAMVMENDIIDSYQKQYQLEMKTTGSGLRYKFYNQQKNTPLVVSGDVVNVSYKISLIDGTLCYQGIKDFKVDNDRVERGLHEGIKLMRVGDKALFILPSHLAHGLMGDESKIPPKAILVCEIELREIKK